MKKLFITLFLLAVGAAIGSAATWTNSYKIKAATFEEEVSIEKLLAHSTIEITDSNYACEGKPLKTVGAVVASIIEYNNLSTRNRLSYGCVNNTCSLSISSCKPWQLEECGDRILKFDINDQNGIKLHTFACIDMP